MPAGTRHAASGGGGLRSKCMHSVAILGSSLSHGLHSCFPTPLSTSRSPWWCALRTVVSQGQPGVTSGIKRSEQPWLEAVSPFRSLGTPPTGQPTACTSSTPHGATYGVNIKYTHGATYGVDIEYAPRGNLRREHQVRPPCHHVNIEYAPRDNLRREHQVRPPGATHGGNIEYSPPG